ncbi:hypothetical protein ACVWYD_002712 [Morganella morganii]
MATIPTQNAVPSEAPRDLKFNSGKIDEFVTSLEHEYKDRFGRCHMTIEGMRWIFEQLMERFKVDITQAIIAAGYIPMDSFQQGAEITKRNEILRYETTGEYYRWDGDLPKSVPAGSTPESAGGVGMGAWIGVGDAALRSDLISGDGSLVGVGGDTLKSFFDREDWRRFNSVRGYGVSGDDLTPVNDYISTADDPVLFTAPAGVFTGNFTWKSGFGLIGSGSQSTIVNVPSGQSGIVMSSQIVRGGEISKMTIATESPTAGRGIDGNTWGMVNCRLSDLYLNKFDIGYKAGATDFSCTFDNVRANECRISFDLTGGGGLIQNVFNNCYSSAPSELGLNIAGVKGAVFNCYNSGSTGARHVLIGLGSKGVIFNSPNFEQDAGYLGVNQAAVTILSSSEVILNSPQFASPAGAPGSTNTYLVRVQDSAVVHINTPTVTGGGENIKHLYVAGDAVVYLNDPLGVFTKIDVLGNGRVIRTHKISNAPDYIGKHLAVKSGDIINFGFAPRHIVAVPDFSAVAVPNPFVRSVHFDTYGSLTAVARIVNTTTGATDTTGSLNILVQAWR